MSEARPDAGVRALCTSQLALRARFDELRRALEPASGADRVLAARAFQVALHERTDVERRLLLPLLARGSVPGRDAPREIEVQHAQLDELARHLHERARRSDAADLEPEGLPRPGRVLLARRTVP